MAVAAMTVDKLTLNEWADLTAGAAATTAADGVTIDYSDVKDKKIVVIATNSHASAAKTVTLKGGNGTRGVSDLAAKSIAAGEKAAITVDSAYFMNETGDNAGKVLIVPESTDITFEVIALP